MVHEMACFSGRAPPAAALSPFHDEQDPAVVPEEVYHGHEEGLEDASCGSGHGAGGGLGKMCTRGHWRPAEDAKLKELVAQYGPQNWNLIAEKLDGRSGNAVATPRNADSCVGVRCVSCFVFADRCARL